uniref:Uncharacterized protein n=1 Tax=Siphoviridae sp. ctr2f5 TaxID=2825684 RepID=A0A8S5QDM7_9CAUD|nr:MAG TPA: hypothetical protein [Siphoviridae sp. ctr2f5]
MFIYKISLIFNLVFYYKTAVTPSCPIMAATQNRRVAYYLQSLTYNLYLIYVFYF